jgi:hypothetical protein
MKLINDFINEKLTVNSKTKLHKDEDNILSKIPNKILNGVYELAQLFERTILQSNNNLQENDFEENEDGTFNLMNVPQDGKLVKEFWKERSTISSVPLTTAESDSYKSIIIRNTSGDDIFIRINIDTEDGRGYKKGDISSVDMSEEIKYILLNR